MPVTISAIAGGAGLAKSIYGIIQDISGNSNLSKLQVPQRTTDPNILKNQQLAQQIASEGMPDSAKNYYSDSINRTLGQGINAILAGGGDINMISSLVNGATDAYRKISAQDAQQKLANQGVLLNANKAVANENETNWNWDVANPYLQKYARYTQQTNSGAQNIAGGLQDVASAGNAYLTGQKNSGGTNSSTSGTSNYSYGGMDNG